MVPVAAARIDVLAGAVESVRLAAPPMAVTPLARRDVNEFDWPSHGEPGTRPGATCPARDQRGQGEHAALPLVVCSHYDQDVLDRDHQDEGVDDERQDAKHVLVRRWHRMRTEEALLQRVQRAGPDVAIDDTQCSERQGKKPLTMVIG